MTVLPQYNGTLSSPAAVTVDTSADLILAANADRVTALIVNNGSVTVYLGKANTVTAANGLPLVAGATLEDGESGSAWYGITASGSSDVRVLEVS
jgi:hypothetical protein